MAKTPKKPEAENQPAQQAPAKAADKTTPKQPTPKQPDKPAAGKAAPVAKQASKTPKVGKAVSADKNTKTATPPAAAKAVDKASPPPKGKAAPAEKQPSKVPGADKAAPAKGAAADKEKGKAVTFPATQGHPRTAENINKVEAQEAAKRAAAKSASKAPAKKAAPAKADKEAPTAKEDTPPAPPVAAPRNSKDGPEKIEYINLSQLHAFKDHPFQVRDDEKMRAMVESVKDKGVTQPAIVRPREGGGFELVSGHRRQKASELAGFFEMPCIVRDLTDEQAITQMVEDNTNQRENILPSERAKALKMQLEAIKHQGRGVFRIKK